LPSPRLTSGAIPFEQERIFRELGLWLFINEKRQE
jgi:hypothetical protein